MTKEIDLWTDDCREEMRCVVETTVWQIFFDSCDNPLELTDTITSYLLLNESKIMRTKMLQILLNNKLWISSDLKQCINEKKNAFIIRNAELVRKKRRELRCKMRKARTEYKDKVEEQ